MEMIAADAGISRATLYRYFTSREHVVCEAALAWGHELAAKLPAAVAGSRDVIEALRGSTMALALSGRDDKVAVLDVREGVRQLGTAPADASTCLVFGPEQSGLTFEEMALCGRRALAFDTRAADKA